MKIKTSYLSFILLFCSFSSVFSQGNKSLNQKEYHFSLLNDSHLFLKTSADVLQAPFNFNQQSWNLMSTVFISALASVSVDDNVRKEFKNIHSKSLDDITLYGEKFGQPLYGGVLSILMYSGGALFKDKYTKDTGQILAEAMLLDGFYTLILKVVFGRARPYAGDGKLDFDIFKFEFKANENSFPSGHTSTAFTVATVLSERFNNTYASIFLYSMASLTAFQRIYDDKHWLSDTILGAALGTFVGLRVVDLYEKENIDDKNYKLSFYPSYNLGNMGLGISLQF